MRLTYAMIVSALAQYAAVSQAGPVLSSPVLARSQFCANAPNVKAGT